MANELWKEMCSYADTKLDFMTKTRQDFHRFAESGWHEVRTCSLIARHLKNLGYEKVLMGRECLKDDARMGLPAQEELDYIYQRALEQGADPEFAPYFKDGFTCVAAVLETGRPGPVIATRQDIDALGVLESREESHRPAREGFASVNDGEMHACGHDAHAAIGMTVADVLWKYRDLLNGTVKIIFQPSEEGVRGAKAVAESGLLDDVDYILGCHMGARKNGTDTQLGFHYFMNMANAKWDVYLTGRACHAAAPEEGHSAMLAMASIIQGVYGIPRAGCGDSRINVGQVTAGTGRNVVCDRVKMVMELRGLTQAALDYLEPYARSIIEHSAAMHGCTAEIKVMGASPCAPLSTDSFVDELVALARKLGYSVEEPKACPNSEDYTYMAQRVMAHGGRSCYFSCLSDYPAPGHATTFDIAEKDLPNAVKFECAVITYLMGITIV